MSDAATRFLSLQIGGVGLPAPVEEYRFHATRRWRLDLAWPDLKVAVEVEGGVWMQTETGRGKGHAHPKRFLQDMDKYNAAALDGWRVFRVTPQQVNNGKALALVEKIFKDKK